MNASDLLFRTGRFNLSRVGEHFINPCCFGQDLAEWMRKRLRERGFDVRQAYQEDWGWELPVRSGERSYFLCMSGNADGSSANPDEGEWRIIVEKKRPIWQRLTGGGKITSQDEMLTAIAEILRAESDIRDVQVESDRQD